MPVGPIAPAIKVLGSPLGERVLGQLTSLKIERGLGLIGRATLRFLDAGYVISSSRAFPLEADITVGLSGKGVPLFHGEVTGVSLDQSAQAVPELVVTVDEPVHRLAHGTKSRTFLNISHHDAIRKILDENGLSGSDLNGVSSTPHEYVMLTGTAFAQIQALASRSGTVWWYDPELKKVRARKLSRTLAGTASAKLGENLLEFSVRATAHTPSGIEVSGWEPAQQQTVVGSADTSRSPESEFVSGYAGKKVAGGGRVAVADLAPITGGEANTLASAMLAERQSEAVLARGVCLVDPAVQPACTVQVEGAGPTSGSYLVTEVRHVYDSRGFHTHFTAGPYRPSGLVDLLGPAAAPGSASLSGVVVGVVTNVKDPDTSGRAKVKYVNVGEAVESHWARIATIGGGSGRGMVFQPEVNDEVLVAFEHGDPRRPVILGGLFSKKNQLPKPDQSNVGENSAVKFRRITSRRGHAIELADGESDAEQHVLITLDGAKHRLRLGKDRFDVEVPSGKPVLIRSGQAKFEITAGGDVVIEGKTISLKAASGDVKVEGINVAAKATSEFSAEGITVKMKSSGPGTVEAGGPLALKGAMVAIN
jgi:uncharacterized protein involved in type VI secretion and phage assembly